MKLLLSLLSAGLASLSVSVSQTPPPLDGVDPFRKNAAQPPAPNAPAGQQIKLVFEAYSLDPMIARDLLVNEGPGRIYGRVLELAKAGKAKLEFSPSLVIPSGDRVQIKENRDYQYATEWEQPWLRRPTDEREGKKAPGDKNAPAVVEKPDGWAWTASPTPTAFMTRELGLNLDALATLHGSFCEVAFDFRYSSHSGDREVLQGTKVMQPTFGVRRLRISSFVQIGVTSLLGTLNAPRHTGVPNVDAEPPVTLLFVTVGAEGAEAAQPPIVEPPPGSYLAVIQVFSMASEVALEVSKTMSDAAIARCLEFTAARQATLEQLAVIRGEGGASGEVDSHHEFQYPTEWDPRDLTESEAADHPEIPAIFSLPFPTAMEFRDVGFHLDFSAEAERDDSWDGSIKTRTVRLDSEKEYAAGSHLFHPEISTREASSRVSVGCADAGPVAGETGEMGVVAIPWGLQFLGTIASAKDANRSSVAFLIMRGAHAEKAKVKNP